MNLHGLAVGYVGIVNANRSITLKRYTGITQNDNFEREPSYTSTTILAQVQALSSDQLHTASNLNLQGEMRSVICADELRGVSKPDQKGGDMLNFDGHDWLVVHVQEMFSDHTMAIVQKQV
jgi:hypothetical protein